MRERVSAFVKLLVGNPRDSRYGLAWAVLALAIVLVIFLAMQLWIDCAIVAAFLGVCAFVMGYPSALSPDMRKELDDAMKEIEDEEDGG